MLSIDKKESFEIQIEKYLSKKLSVKAFSNNYHKNRFDMNILYEARKALLAK